MSFGLNGILDVVPAAHSPVTDQGPQDTSSFSYERPPPSARIKIKGKAGLILTAFEEIANCQARPLFLHGSSTDECYACGAHKFPSLFFFCPSVKFVFRVSVSGSSSGGSGAVGALTQTTLTALQINCSAQLMHCWSSEEPVCQRQQELDERGRKHLTSGTGNGSNFAAERKLERRSSTNSKKCGKMVAFLEG